MPIQNTAVVSMPFRLEPYSTTINADDAVYQCLHSTTVHRRWELERKLRAREDILGKFGAYYRGLVDKKTIMEGYPVDGYDGELGPEDLEVVHSQKTRRFEKELREYNTMMKDDKVYGRWIRPEIKILQLATRV